MDCKLRGGLPYSNLLAWCEARTQYKWSRVPKVVFWSYYFITINHTFNFRRLKNGSSGPYFLMSICYMIFKSILVDIWYLSISQTSGCELTEDLVDALIKVV